MISALLAAEVAAPSAPPVRPLTLETRVAGVVRLISQDPHLTSRKIQAVTAAAFGLAPSVLTGPSAAAEHVRPRYIAMALCRHFMSRGRSTRLGPGTITAVARAFGKDRTCVREAEARYGSLVADAIAEVEGRGIMTETAFDHVRVTDFETTGFPPGAQVVEAAFCDVVRDGERWLRGGAWSSLVDPGMEIPAPAMAVHHITDEDVKGAPTFTQVLPNLGLRDADEPVRVFAAHKMDFERAFYAPPDAAWICTWRCAVTKWPEAPGFKNQELRYWLGLKLIPEMCARPHRAPDDAYVTAAILVQMLKTSTVEELIKISASPVVLPYLHFGMHAMVRLDATLDAPDGGWQWAVPTSYLEYLIKQPPKTAENPKGMDPDVRHTAFHHLNARRSQ